MQVSSNSVSQLRASEIASSTREFKARGSRLIRCEQCLLAKPNCICGAKPTPCGDSAFCFIFYKGEVTKPSNTGRLVADVIADNHAFLWDRTRPNPALLALLNDSRYRPVLLFPHQYAEEHRHITHINQRLTTDKLSDASAEKTPLYIMLDGTWREAKKMFKSPYLTPLPVLSIVSHAASSYLLRDGAHKHQLCTAEIAIEVLKLANDREAADKLASYFKVFCDSYSAVKPHIFKKQRAPGQESNT